MDYRKVSESNLERGGLIAMPFSGLKDSLFY
jgi:hypothetical protein